MRVENLKEGIEGAPTCNYGIVKGTLGWDLTISWGAQVFPEERMVDVSTTIEVDGLLQRYELANVTSGKGLSLLL